MQRQAVIDCGSNSFRLLIADVKRGRFQVVYRDYRTVRLGAGLKQFGGIIDQATWERCYFALRDFQKAIRDYQCQKIWAIGTSTLRSAENGEQFIATIEKDFAIQIDIIDGDLEARYSFVGATNGAETLPGTAVIDIGGGSTELAVATQDGLWCRSIAVGAVRLTNLFYSDAVYPSSEAREQLNKYVHSLWQQVNVRPEAIIQLIGVAGTITTLAAIHHQLTVYEPDRIRHTRLGIAEINLIRANIAALNPQQRQQMRGMFPPARADIILAGIDILLATMGTLKQTAITVQPSCLLEGVLIVNSL